MTPDTIYPIAIAILTLWLVTITIVFQRTNSQLKLITKGITKKDLKTILADMAMEEKMTLTELKNLKNQLTGLEGAAANHLQKIGYVRFNPFSDTGGNQSFTLCLLNGHNDGIVITSLHSRESTRLYTKPIKRGAVDDGRELSKEELQVVKQAIKQASK